MKNRFKALTLVAIALFLGACNSTSRVHFEGPAKAKMSLDGVSYTYPVSIDLPQSADVTMFRSNAGGKPVNISLPDGTKLRGFLHVYTIQMSQVEMLAKVSFSLTASDIQKLKSGHAVSKIGYSAGKKPVYKMILGLDS